MSLERYLAFEAASPIAHEYRSGFAVALATPARNHARIAMNLSIALGAAARAAGCDAYAGDVKVVTPGGDRVIPDFAITCDARDTEPAGDRGEGTIAHPWLVVEILSPATVADDLTAKMDAYASIAELAYYVVVDSRRRAMRAFERVPGGRLATTGAVRTLSLRPRLPCEIEIDAIYAGTTVPSLDDAASEP